MENQPETPEVPLCPGCSAALNPEWQTCPYCGRRIKRKAIPRRIWIAAAAAAVVLVVVLGLIIARPWAGGPGLPLALGPHTSSPPAPTSAQASTMTPSPRPSELPTATASPTTTPTPRPSPTWTPSRTSIQFASSPQQSGGIGQGSSRSKTLSAQPVTVVTQPLPENPYSAMNATAGVFFDGPAPDPDTQQSINASGGGNLSSSGDVCVSYYNRSQGDLYFTCRTISGVWGSPFPKPIDRDGNVGLFTSLAFDPQKQPWISYYDQTNGDLKVATEQNGAWILLVVDGEGNTGKYSALAMGANGLPVIAYYDASRTMLRLARATQGGWYLQDVEPIGKISGDYRLALRIDANGVIYLAYQNNLDKKLRLTRLINEQFSTETVDSSPNLAIFTSMALYPDGRIGISYYGQGSRHLKYSFGSPGGWQMAWASEADESGRFNSLAISPNGIPYISFFLENPDSLLIASSDSGFWQRITLQKNRYVGQHTSLTINQQGQAAIVYYDGNWLKAAIGPTSGWYNTYDWRFENVDTSGDTGLYASIQYR